MCLCARCRVCVCACVHVDVFVRVLVYKLCACVNVDQESVLRLSRRRTTQIMMNIHKALVFVGFLSNANAYDVERAPPLREHSFSKPFQGKLLQKVVPPLSLPLD